MRGLLKSLFSYPATKLFAILLAVVIWFYAKSTEVQERVFNAPVVAKNIEDQYLLSDIGKDTISIRLMGRGIDLMKMKEEEVLYVIDCDDMDDGRNKVKIDKDDVLIPKSGIEVKEIEEIDDYVFVNIVKRMKKRVPIRPTITGMPSTGFYIYERPISEPDYAVIYGSEDIVDDILYVTTEAIDVSDATESVTREVQPLTKRDDIDIFSPESVLITIPIEEFTERKFEDVEIVVPENVKDLIENIEESATILLRGPRNVIDEISTDEIKIYPDQKQINQHKSVVELVYEAPEHLSVQEINPVTIKVDYK